MRTIKRPETIPADRLDSFKAYEYEDLDQLKIRVLNWLEEAPVITRKKKSDLLNDIMTVDIESTTIPAETDYNHGDKAFAVPYIYQSYIAGAVFICRYDDHFLAFWKWLDGILSGRGLTLPIYIHNLSYEYHFFKSRFPIDFESVFALQSRRIAKFVLPAAAWNFAALIYYQICLWKSLRRTTAARSFGRIKT